MTPRKKIAVITARADDSEQKSILYGIAEAAFSMQADVAVFSNIYNHWIRDEILNFENHIYDFFQPEQFGGVIVTAEAFMDLSQIEAVLDRIRTSGIPAVMIGGESEGFLSVTPDDAADLGQITEHLLTVHGLRQIDILTGPADSPAAQERVRGCRSAFEKHGIPFDESSIIYGDFWNDSGEALAAQYLNGTRPLPQAVICTNDYMAFGLCDVLSAAGIPIPETLTVTGYDTSDSRLLHHPILTTFRRDRRSIGALAVGRLFDCDVCIGQEDRFIPGNTCGCGVDTAYLMEELRYARIVQFHTQMSSVAQFTSYLTGCRTLAEYIDVLREQFTLLHGADRLYLCLDQNWNSAGEVGETLLCCTVDPSEEPGLPVPFSREELLPALHEEREHPMLFYFSPLCVQKRQFGYTVLGYNTPQCYDFSFRDWNKNVSHTLEFLRMKNDIHYLKQCQQVSSLYDSLTGFYQAPEFRKIVETSRKEQENMVLQGIKLLFPAGDTYLYGENYRSDVVAESARILKRAARKHEICCRAQEDAFLVLCRTEDSGTFHERLTVLLNAALRSKYTEEQVTVVYAQSEGEDTAKSVKALLRRMQSLSEEAARAHLLRRELPHFSALLDIRTQMYRAPKNTLTTQEVCRQLCISEGYFRVIYKKAFGTSYMQDQIAARILYARYLLLTTAMSIYAVARRCGYSDEKYFDRQFRQSTGMPPMQYRAEYC